MFPKNRTRSAAHHTLVRALRHCFIWPD